MSRINTNIPSLVAQRIFSQQNNNLANSLSRLSTGLRINSGKDDPAGLIASENLRAEKVALNASLTNISRADNIVAVAEGALDEVNQLLTELEDLVDRSANEAAISTEERDANQLQIDSIIDSINRIANNTEFQGNKLLDGSYSYGTSSVPTSAIYSVEVLAGKIDGSRQAVVEVVGSAQVGSVQYASSNTGGTTVTLEVQGNTGADVFSFASNTAISAVAAAVNNSTELTGVFARISGTNLFFESDYGSSQFASVKTLSGTFNVVGNNRDEGEDAQVRVNGVAAIADGLKVSARSSTLSVDFQLTVDRAQNLGTSTFHVKEGGADFAITPDLSLSGLVSIGLPSISAGSLGTTASGFVSDLATGGSLSLREGIYAHSQQIIRTAQDTVSKLRGRLGAFQKNTLETTKNSLQITLENLTAAESTIRDTDFASETSNLTRAQILVQSTTNTLRLANQTPQNVLALLG